MSALALVVAAGILDYTPAAPPPIDLPAAGGVYVDPVFGTTILRVTDATAGTHCVHAYSYWPALNADDTRLLLACDGEPLLYRFDPDAFTAIPDGPLAGDDGAPLELEGATWSHADPDVLFALGDRDTRLFRVDVSRRGAEGYTLLRDFAGLFDYPFYLAQLGVADDDRTFTFHSRDPATGAHLDAVAWDAATDELWILPRGEVPIDETKIDKQARLVMVDNAAPTYGWRVWDFRAGAIDEFTRGDPDDRPGGHVDMGRDFLVNSDGWNTGLMVRRWDDLHGADAVTNIVAYLRPDGSANWTIAEHASLRADAETFVIGSTYAGDGSWHAFEDEIYLAWTDGSGFVRLAHTRSAQASSSSGWRYWAQPRAVVDRSGRFVVYTSDLGSPDRHDVMVLAVPPEYWPPQPEAPPATPLEPDPPATSGAGGAGDDAPPAQLGGSCAAAPCARGGAAGRWILLALLALSAAAARARSGSPPGP